MVGLGWLVSIGWFWLVGFGWLVSIGWSWFWLAVPGSRFCWLDFGWPAFERRLR